MAAVTRSLIRRAGPCAGACAAAVLLLAGCGGGDDGPNAADKAFLQQMIPHHERAVAVARLAMARATDPRVRGFAIRIVGEQTPELDRMRASAKGLDLDLGAGARTAQHRISDAQVTELRRLRGAAFDRDFLRLNIRSESGAAEMARTEVGRGADDDTVALATDIATAPVTQIPELRRLLTALGG